MPRSGAAAAILLKAALCVTAGHWLVQGQLLRSLVSAVCLGLALLPRRLARRSTLAAAFDLWWSATLAAHVVLGMAAGGYDRWLYYDKLAHAAAFAGLAWLGRRWLEARDEPSKLRLPGGAQRGLVAMGALAIGAAWEIFEYAVDKTGLFSAQRGLDDTMLDLVVDFLGAAMGCLISRPGRMPPARSDTRPIEAVSP